MTRRIPLAWTAAAFALCAESTAVAQSHRE